MASGPKVAKDGCRSGSEGRKPPHKPRPACFQIFPWVLASGKSAQRKTHHLTRALSYQRPQSYGGPSKATRRPNPRQPLGSDENWPRTLGAAALQPACCVVTSSPERGQRITAGGPVPSCSPSPQGSRPCLLLSGGLAIHTQDTAVEPLPPHK